MQQKVQLPDSATSLRTYWELVTVLVWVSVELVWTCLPARVASIGSGSYHSDWDTNLTKGVFFFFI